MRKKIIPFVNGQTPEKKASKSVPPFDIKSKGPKESLDGSIIEHGDMGSLNYEIYSRGVIHIFNKTLRFKKDLELFEEIILNTDFNRLKYPHIIEGSGDNADLIFSRKNKEITLSLRAKKRIYNGIERLKAIVKK